jgi:hypothetical protein
MKQAKETSLNDSAKLLRNRVPKEVMMEANEAHATSSVYQ